MDWITEASTKHESLIRRLGMQAPVEKSARFDFFRGAEEALVGYIDKKEIEVIIQSAELLSANLWDDD